MNTTQTVIVAFASLAGLALLLWFIREAIRKPLIKFSLSIGVVTAAERARAEKLAAAPAEPAPAPVQPITERRAS